MKNLYKKTAEHLDLPVEVVKAAYESFYDFIRNTIKNLPLKDYNTDVSELRSSFNIPSIGKLYCNEKKVEKIRNNYDIRYRKN